MIVSPIIKKVTTIVHIALLSIPCKIFLRILLERTQSNVDRKLKESLIWFPCRHIVTVDAILLLFNKS